MIVKNMFPRLPANFKLALIGEAPGSDEAAIGEPFVGASGRLLQYTIGQLGFAFRQCFVGNVCQIQPPGNDISAFDLMGPERTEGRQQLFEDLLKFDPNCCLLMGQTAMSTFRSSADRIGNFRGSLFLSDLTPTPWKCLAAHHPAAVLREFDLFATFRLDLKRCLDESASKELILPTRTFVTHPSFNEVAEFLAECRQAKLTAFDIEGYADNVGVTMISFSHDPKHALVVPFWFNKQHYWNEVEEAEVWRLIANFLGDPNVSKVCQNGLYETFVLGWRHQIIVRGLTDDTMFAHWELFPEFPKNLGFQTSIYTREPYYKEDRESDDPETKLVYNAKDSCVTREIIDVVVPRLSSVPASLDHYRFNCSLIEPYTYIHLRGCRLSKDALVQAREKAQAELAVLQFKIETELGRPFNPKSINDKKWLLYEHLKYTPYQRYGRTTKEEVILKYRAKYGNPILSEVFRAVQKRTRLSDLGKLTTNDDGRIRSSYNPVATNTGRLNSTESNARVYYHTKTGLLKWTGTGTNLQNVTEDVRVCFVPDNDDFEFFQCDLAGADGWTVAADLAALGHPSMLDDYLAGIKPAKVLLLMLEAQERGERPEDINRLGREELRRLTEVIDTKAEDSTGRPRGWKYLCMKRVQHGTNYGAEPETVGETIFKDSEGAIDLDKKTVAQYQWLYKMRYTPDARAQWVLRELETKGYLTAACGIRRKFFQIRNPKNIDKAVLRAALAFEPQANTTYATNAALKKLYFDPENRNSQGHLFVEPLLQIHDAIAGQLRKKHRQWAARKARVWFDNELMIHGIKVVIPYDGKVGPNWRDLEETL